MSTEVSAAPCEDVQPKGEDVTPDGDGGVLKEIKVAGSGQGPMTGDKVFVHYTGTLTDGTKFDSSRDRGQQFEFELGKGQVIRAWDIGVASMKRGEVCVLTCRGDYAYGESGSPPKIPPNATLLFEVELFDWKGEDLTKEKDGGITRSVVVAGDGYQTPNDGANCEIQLMGTHGGNVFEQRDVSFTIGEGCDVGIIESVEVACKKMKKGEKSLIKVLSAYAYGNEGNKDLNIPPSTDVEYEITMKNFEKAKEKWEMDATEKIEQAAILKDKGTSYFKSAEYKKAIRQYKTVVEYLEHEENLSEEQVKTRSALLLAAHLNLAMCYLKMDMNLDARKECDEAVTLEPKSEKAFFRRGMAMMNLNEFEDAIVDFKTVLNIDAGNKAAKKQLIIANKKIKEEKDKDKKTYAGMFQKFVERDQKKAAVHERRIGDVFHPVEDWSNDMASGMMTIEQEMAAFGEKMPESKYGKDTKENQNPDEKFETEDFDL